MKNAGAQRFDRPSALERLTNRLFGWLVGSGLGLSHNYLLQVRGRKTGKLYSTPVNLLRYRDKKFLVAPRGYTQWVRNAQSSGTVRLKKGRAVEEYRLQEIPNEHKPAILKAYLDAFKTTVQRYFPVAAGSPAERFVAIADDYPVFELQ